MSRLKRRGIIDELVADSGLHLLSPSATANRLDCGTGCSVACETVLKDSMTTSTGTTSSSRFEISNREGRGHGIYSIDSVMICYAVNSMNDS